MLIDDEYEAFVTTPERIKALGFKPQKELLTNHLLPYADKLDDESQRFLEQVKTNLAKSVMLREMKPACGVWSSRLMKYIRIHGLKFGKEDHLALIKLAYELVLIPDLEPCKVHKFATLFLMLTKKRFLISPEELTLPWRPLYDVGIRIFEKSSTSIGMYHYHTGKSGNEKPSMLDMVRKFISGYGLDDALELFGLALPDESDLLTSLETSYMTMIKCAKPYFEVGATKEMLEELLPQICPWSSNSQMMGPFTTFLPVGLYPKYAEQGHLLWFDQLMNLWDVCYNNQCGISDVMILFAGLAKKNPGAVDWTPHVPKMFMRFLHALNLPVSYKDMQYTKNHSLDMKVVASWIVWTINPDSVVLKHLRSFLAGVESYLQSANAGRWSFKLRDLLRKLAREFLIRVRREREKKLQETWENKTPEHYKLRDEDITEFVKIVLEPTLQAVYSRSGSLDISVALQNLATLRPAIVIPPLIERLRTSLTSLTEPHRVTAAMSAVAAVARPMIRGADADYPEGPTHVVPFLMAVLPGLDPNDIKKTLVTLHFILIFSGMIPYIDCSSAHEYYPDLTEEELLVCESTAQFEDFVLIFLDRLFIIIESSITEHARLDTKDHESVKSKTDAVIETAISSAATAVLMQCSPKIFKEALRKFKSFATETTFETNVAGSMVGVLLKVFSRIDSESTLAAFLPKLIEELTELVANDDALKEENPPRDLCYRLVLFKQVIECDGTALLKYIPQIIPVLDRILKLHATYALIRAADALAHIFHSLSNVDVKEWRSSAKDYGSAPQTWLPIREWGGGCLMKDANLVWHVPNAEEAECAQMLVDRYVKHEVTRLRQWLSGERDLSRERRMKSFYIFSAMTVACNLLPPPDEEHVAMIESQVPATCLPLATAVPYQVTLDGENMRVALTRLLVDVQTRMLADKTDDTRGLDMLIQVWERIIVVKGLRSGPGLEAKLRSYNALERALDGRGGLGKAGVGNGGDEAGAARLRMLVADAARVQFESRLDLVCDAGMTPSGLQALDALYELSINTYSTVRVLAQIGLYWMLSHFPYSYRALVPKLVALLAKGGEGDEWHARHKGALHIILYPKQGPMIAKQDWDVVRTLWPAILKAPLSEKPSIQRLEQAFSDCLHRQFPAVNTRLTISDGAIEAAQNLLPKAELNDLEFKAMLDKAVEKELATSDRTEKVYNELIEELVDIAETPNVQWRRLELAMQMLTYCPLVQTPYPPSAVRLVVRSLLHDDIAVRRTAQKLTLYALKQRKNKIKKIEIDPYEIMGSPKPEKHIPGYREDLEWAIWSEDKEIKTDEEWDRPWLRDYIYGFFAWPKKLKIAAPISEQKFSLDTPLEEMEEGERYLFEFFSNEANIDRLVAFYTVEEKKGKDKFNGIRFTMFRMAFAQFGERVSSRLMDHALRCAGDTQEAPQRFAAEIAAAALRAPRYWPRARALALYRTAMEVIKAGLTSVTAETMEDWGTCVATGVEKLDPIRGSEVLKELLQLCAPPPALGDADPDHHTSFVVCARLYALQGALGSLTWRAAPLAAELLKRLDAANFIQHPYQNVRETVGSILMTIFDTELVFPGGSSGKAPRLQDFLADIKPRLAALYDENGDIVINTAASLIGDCASQETCVSPVPPVAAVAVPLSVLAGNTQLATLATDPPHAGHAHQTEGTTDPVESESEESRVDKQLVERLDTALRLAGDAAPTQRHHARAVNLLTTVLRGCMGVIVRGVCGNTETQYELVSTACALAARGPPQPHEELPRAAGGFLASLALANHSYKAFDKALEVLESLAEGRSWWARLACLEFAQPLLFYGLPMLCDRADRAVRAERFALKLMRDSRLEVRQAAAKLLTGLMHCRALPDEEKTLKSLTRSCKSKELVERHCGVLGLCGYLSSRPYSLGPKLGDVLAELARHTSAPDPIPATIRTALADFRRTHQDDWPKHREQLTEEELDLLADLTSPPSYCA
ncbi:proteasome activator complex subunit 4-like isoform X1 [Maniola hyperantus]|uniref:proteasome activator complex subunit 4-like isoform X1 n=1 Tax=Aphantopus hyperantus TaxID=2795564 RepID=UPI00156A3EB7|nr:proteasome activator complex subunit 4-like [Maniola hyperantus]